MKDVYIHLVYVVFVRNHRLAIKREGFKAAAVRIVFPNCAGHYLEHLKCMYLGVISLLFDIFCKSNDKNMAYSIAVRSLNIWRK